MIQRFQTLNSIFQSTFQGNREACIENTMNLPMQDPGTFRFFIHWLYTGKIERLLLPGYNYAIGRRAESREGRPGVISFILRQMR